MEVSIFLAQALGLYFLLAGVAMLIRPNAMEELMVAFNSRSFIYASGFFALLIGVPLVLMHNVWDGSWRVTITVIAWLALLKGVVRVYSPDSAFRFINKLGRSKKLMQSLVVLMVLVGAYLTYMGFA